MSIFLLKTGKAIEDCLEDPAQLEELPVSGVFPVGSRFFLRKGRSQIPWWIPYFGVQADVLSKANGALVFLPARDRTFALAFGSARFNLADDAYDHDFGTRVVLNCIDPDRLKSTDLIDPGSSRRQRTQIPFDADLSYFGDLDDSSVLRSLTGKVSGQFAEVVRSVTGAYNLRITTDTPAHELVRVLEDSLSLSLRTDYLTKFPTLRWLVPVTDPDVVGPLNEGLLDSLYNPEAPVSLAIPDIVDYGSESLVSFSGAGPSDLFDDVYIRHYREYLQRADVPREMMSLEQLKRHKLRLLDDELNPKHTYSIYRSLICEVPSRNAYTYHLSDGVWYRVAQDLIDRLRTYLNVRWRSTPFPPFEGPDEAAYNQELADAVQGYCLDRKSISPRGESQLEPCDVLRWVDGRLELIHVKIGTTSDRLSHHFNQGVNSLTLLLEQADARRRLADLIELVSGEPCPVEIGEALEARRFSVLFVIATHKEELGRSDNLPLFSRLSLRRQLRSIDRAQIPAHFEFVADATEARAIKRSVQVYKADLDDSGVYCTNCHIRAPAHLLLDGICQDCVPQPAGR